MKNVALITGASSGIGKDFAYIHAEKKGDLILIARREDKLKEIKSDIESMFGVEVITLTKDLTDSNAPHEIYELIKDKKIQVDYLINNAGFGGHGKFHERDWSQDMSMIQLNVLALTELTRHFLPDFVERNEGKIMNISSTASLMPGPLQAVYYATKAYVSSFSNALAEELHDTNVSVTNIMPGATETEFAATSGMDKTSMFSNAYSSRKVAEDSYHAMMKGKLNKVTGMGLMQRMMLASVPFMPMKMRLRTIRKMQEA